ncbi:MAG: O-antigen ligase family protein, partial [Cycloclasticus sp.]|nr:O-antigen ligase family protein [Cycloclasticus sp.]
VLVAAAVIGALLSLWRFWGIWQGRGAAYWLWVPRMTFWGSADNSIIGASLYAPAVVCAYLGSQGGQGWRRIFWLLGGVLVALLILRTYSRGPLLAIFGALLLGVILSRERKTRLLLGLVIVIGAIWLGYQDTGNMLARGVGVRPHIWLNVWFEVLQAPLIGHGLLSDESINMTSADVGSLMIDHPHSIFMATLFYGGLVGMVLLLGLLVSGARAGVSACREGQGEMLLLLLLAVALGVTDNNKLLLSPSPLWLFYWLPFGLAGTRMR